MNRIDQRFADLSAAGKKAFIAYICAAIQSEVTRDICWLEKAGVTSSSWACRFPILWRTAL